MLDWTQMDLERYLEIQVDWDFVDEKEMERIPFSEDENYRKHVAKRMLNQYAESLFQISASKLGIYYNKETENIYKRKNRSFYKLSRTIGLIGEDYLGRHRGDKLIEICSNIILPRPNKPEKIILKLKKLSEEDLAEVLLYIAGKEIKIQAVDRN